MLRDLLAKLPLTVVAGACLAACASAPQPAHLDDPAEGRRLAEAACASCHAIGRLDTSPNIKAPALRDVLTWYPADMLVSDLANAKSIGWHEMPVFYLGEHEPKDLVAYLKTLQVEPTPGVGGISNSKE